MINDSVFLCAMVVPHVFHYYSIKIVDENVELIF